jgi:hypothetical protein
MNQASSLDAALWMFCHAPQGAALMRTPLADRLRGLDAVSPGLVADLRVSAEERRLSPEVSDVECCAVWHICHL